MRSNIVNDDRIEESEVLDLLASLVDKSMVVYDELAGRYRLLETVRQYARDRMVDNGEIDSRRDRHLAHFNALAVGANTHLKGSDQQRWLEALETEHDNLRTALAWSSEQNRAPESGLRMAVAMCRFWEVRGHLGEGRDWLRVMLALGPNMHPTAVRGDALNGAGALAHWQADYMSANRLCEESLVIRRKLGDQGGICGALNNLGIVAAAQGANRAAQRYYEECLSIDRELGDQWGIAMSLNNLGNLARDLADYPTAQALHEESLAIRRVLGDPYCLAMSLRNLGTVAYKRSDNPAARMLFEEGLAIQRELGDRQGIANTLNDLGNVALYQGDYSGARIHFEASLLVLQELGDRLGIAGLFSDLGLLEFHQGNYSSASELYRLSISKSREVGDPLQIAGLLGNIASLAATLADLDGAARIWGAAERLREEFGLPIPANERSQYVDQVGAARAAVRNNGEFDLAWEEGRAMTLEQAIEVALAE